MSLNRSVARLALGIAFIMAALYLRHGEASAQTDMSGMPVMSATPAPTATPAAESTASQTPTPTPTNPAPAQQDMESMPGMAPADSPAAKDSGKAPAKKDMSGMPGMGSTDGGPQMKGMAGMSGDASAPARMSAPGVFVLRPPQKWTPPPGDDRSGELLSRDELRQHMQPLPAPIEESPFYSFPLFDLFEYRYNSSGPDMFVWDFVGWYGGNYNRLWVKTEGRQKLSAGNRGEGDLQLLYGRLISPFWDFQIGVRALSNLGNGSLRHNARTYAVIGFQGLAPGNFDVEPALYISDRGEVSGELTVSADLYLTQRLIVQPRFQGEVTIQGDRRFETGEGGSQIDVGLRLRYDIRREIQPYIGVSWLRNFGANARIAREAGETYDTIAFVAGLQLWW
jgi:copper resistance protein B